MSLLDWINLKRDVADLRAGQEKILDVLDTFHKRMDAQDFASAERWDTFTKRMDAQDLLLQRCMTELTLLRHDINRIDKNVDDARAQVGAFRLYIEQLEKVR